MFFVRLGLGEAANAWSRKKLYINTAQGGIIDTLALHKALTKGWITGAGLDVLPQEPPSADDSLVDLENVILTPHIAFLSEESAYDLEVTAATEVTMVLTGRMPESVVNTEVWGSSALRAKDLRIA